MTDRGDIYLDYAAATPVDPLVIKAMQPYYEELFYNPSAAYLPARQVRQDYEQSKERIAKQLAVKKDQLIMTAGATESINLAFTAAAQGEVATLATEHQAVLAAANQKKCKVVDVQPSGLVDISKLKAAVSDQTTLVSIGLVNSELGTIQPLAKISQALADIRTERQQRGVKTPLYFHTDASQGGAYLDVKPHRLGVDMLTLSAAKLYGPKQVALLYAANHVGLSAVTVGGGQERGLRSGTENVAGVIGFARAYQLIAERRSSEVRRLQALRDSLQHQLVAALPEAVIVGTTKQRVANILAVAFPGVDGERLVFSLESKGVYLATGSACAANLGTRSHVLEAVGLSPAEIDGSLRISIGRQTDEESVRQAADYIIQAVKHEQRRAASK